MGVAETALEADDEFVSDEAIGMEDSVEVFEFVDGFFDVVGDAEEGEVVFGDEAAGENTPPVVESENAAVKPISNRMH